MNKPSRYISSLLIAGLFSLGILVGINISGDSDENLIEVIEMTDHRPSDQPLELAATPLYEPETDFRYADNDAENSQALEDKVADLEARISELEQMFSSQADVKIPATHSRTDARINQLNNLQTRQSLIKAGISEVMADDIIRRRNNLELKKLELHDSATREGYLDSSRYVNEYSELVASETTLREELGDDLYDRYLYSNGQANRVKAISVIMGSSAEQSGMKDGDIIVNYAQQRIFEWNELKKATTEGVLGEYVNVDILRNRQIISLSVPRGPLGVRLGTARISP